MHPERVDVTPLAGANSIGACERTGQRRGGLLARGAPFRRNGRNGDEGTVMIGARVQVVNDDVGFTIVVYAESLREVEQAAKAAKVRYPRSTVRIAFP